MNDRARMQEQLAAIGDRYLLRTLGELVRLKELLVRLHDGAGGALKDIELIVHRVHGSGAMFGFDAISEHARRCEMLCGEGADPQLAAKLEACVQALEGSVTAAARTRGIEV